MNAIGEINVVISARTLSQKPRPARSANEAPHDHSFRNNRTALGSRLKRIRLDKEFTIKMVSERSQVARSTISKIENGQLSPTFDLLQRLAVGLDIDLAALFNGDGRNLPASRRSITRAGMGDIIETKEYIYEALSSDLRRKQMFPLRATIRARGLEEFGGWITHNGEEFLMVISGEVCFFTEFYEPATLKVGDSIYIDSNMGHACISTSQKDAEVIWVCTQVPLGI